MALLRASIPFRRSVLLAAAAVIAVAGVAMAAATARADEAAAWQALRDGGVIAVMRHALAPGTGDPPGFRLDDCATQRNLSAEGRDQATALGEALRRQGVDVAAVYSSQWCRCLETARLLDLGEVRPLPALNSFFAAPERRAPQMATLRQWLDAELVASGKEGPDLDGGAVVLVTHQVVVSALTGVYPASGETVVARPAPGGEVEVIGRIPAP